MSRSRDRVTVEPKYRQPTNGRIITIAEAFPKEQGVQTPHWAPETNVQRRQAPRTSGFEAQCSSCVGEPEDCGKQRLCS